MAAFSVTHEDYAIRLSASLNKSGPHTAYGFEATRKYWYVYLDQITSPEKCISECEKIKKEKAFADAWVHTVKETIDANKSTVEKKSVTSSKVVTLPVDEKKKETASPQVETPPIVAEQKPETPSGAKDKKPETIVTEVTESPKTAPVYLPQTLKNTQAFLSLFNVTNNEVIDGEIDVVNAETNKLMTRVKGNTYVNLPNPGTKSGNLLLISNTFGFRKEQLEINYKETERDTLKPYVKLVGNFYMINFRLSKIQKGDVSTLYNVYFFNDAVVMLPDSKYQLTSLLGMMKENQKMKIILHGHTNGGGRGKIIYMGPSKNFFAITSDAVNGSGSAKELSEARAETIRAWLVAQGIQEERIAVKGWGGSRMIHEKTSAFARKNIRVDVEVTED